jgi:Tfp pilus assembly protein PilF
MSATPPKLSLSQLTLHNPSRMTDAEITATFAVRQRLLDNILADIAAEKPRSRALHQLIIGRRGLGKSTLLARIAASLRDGELANRFIPLVFAEEQYSVDRLSKFWLNCLDSLADAHERVGNKEAAAAIDAILQGLPPSPASEEEQAAKKALEVFLQAAEDSGKRPVLLVDNLQLVFERLSKAQQHVLREVLMRPGCPILIGASPSALPDSQDYGAPFYDQFKIRYLERLSETEMRQLMLHLAEVLDRPDVRDRVLAYPHRISVLRQLTGGNPRTTVTLFLLYAEDFAPGVFGDLQNLLDRVTPLYKALFEELSAQQQVIASAIALRWDPATVRQLSDDTGLAAAAIGAQIDRLERIGFIEKVALHGQTSAGYQITERFFNIWFLMRLGSRRDRQAVEYLARFIGLFYDVQERLRLATQLLQLSELSTEAHFVARALIQTLESAFTGDLQRGTELAVLSQKLKTKVVRQSNTASDWFNWGCYLSHNLDQQNEAEAAMREAVKREPHNVTYRFGLAGLLHHRLKQYQQAEAEYREALLIAPDDYSTLNGLGWLMTDAFKKHQEAEDLFLRATASAEGKNDSLAWRSMAELYHHKLFRPVDAEKAYVKALEIEQKEPLIWVGYGWLLAAEFKRTDDAEAAFQKAIEIDPFHSRAWFSLGVLHRDYRKNLREAERYFEKAFEIAPSDYLILIARLILHRDLYGEGVQARRLMPEATIMPASIASLHLGVFEAYSSNWGNASKHLSDTLMATAEGETGNTLEDLATAIAVLLHLDYGEELLALLIEQNLNVKIKPWYEAIYATHADDKLLLQNLSPEVRETAEKLYDEIDRRLRMLPEKTRRRPRTLEKPKKRRRAISI